jgi:hypothetical protein
VQHCIENIPFLHVETQAATVKREFLRCIISYVVRLCIENIPLIDGSISRVKYNPPFPHHFDIKRQSTPQYTPSDTNNMFVPHPHPHFGPFIVT